MEPIARALHPSRHAGGGESRRSPFLGSRSSAVVLLSFRSRLPIILIVNIAGFVIIGAFIISIRIFLILIERCKIVFRSGGVVIYIRSVIATCNIAHSSADLDSICGYDRSLRGGDISQSHDRFGVAISLFERKGAEIDPCAAPHCLVDDKFLGSSGIIHCVASILSGIRESLIAYIHGILSIFRNISIPSRHGRFAPHGGIHLAISSILKRILSVAEIGEVVDEALKFACGPLLRAVLLLIIRLRENLSPLVGVIIHDHLMHISITLAGKENVGPGILNHRHNKWIDISHCI